MGVIPFRKMHGISNDFVVLDARAGGVAIDGALARALADRHTGIGCDQVLVLETPRQLGAAALMRIFNPDGGEAESCGNGARCVAALLMDESGSTEVTIETAGGLLPAGVRLDGRVTVDMGAPRLGWADVPLARTLDTLHVATGVAPLADAACCSMGNPHATFFVADAEAVDLARLGPRLERHELFPEGANIGVASLLAPDRLRLRLWERGAGLTLACGSGACAALVAAARRGVTGRSAEIVMERGSLSLEWCEDEHVLLTGPVATSFAGEIDLGHLATA